MASYFRIGMLQILNILSFVAVVVINGLADFLPINGQTTGEISNQYPNLFVPASFTFSIWAIIYSLLFLFCIYQGSTLFEKEKQYIDKREKIVDLIGYRFIASCLLNISWILAWHYHLLWLSVLLMLALLAVLIIIFRRLHAAATYTGQPKWFVYVPFSIYLSWISVAAIANITAWLVSIGWNAWQIEEWIWACLMIVVATCLGLVMLFKKKNIFFALVIVWALSGIALKQQAASAGMSNISLAAISGAVLILLLMISFPVRKRIAPVA